MKRKYLYIDGSNVCSLMIQKELTVALPWQHSVHYVADSEVWDDSIQNTCCISMTVMVMWSCRNVTLYVHCLSCYLLYTARLSVVSTGTPKLINRLCSEHLVVRWIGCKLKIQHEVSCTPSGRSRGIQVNGLSLVPIIDMLIISTLCSPFKMKCWIEF